MKQFKINENFNEKYLRIDKYLVNSRWEKYKSKNVDIRVVLNYDQGKKLTVLCDTRKIQKLTLNIINGRNDAERMINHDECFWN